MVRQNLKKPNLQQTRLSVFISNRYVTAQLIKAYPIGDKVICAVNSRELRSYKVTMGLKNYSACYLTGLLLGKRAMRQAKLSKIYAGNQQDCGVTHLVELIPGQPASISSILDIGLRRPTKGNKVFAVMKGLADAGVNIPYSPRRLFGFNEKKKTLDTNKLSNRIKGEDLSKFIEKNVNKDFHFSSYSNPSSGISPQVYPLLVEQAIKAIHKNPKKRAFIKTPSKKPVKKVVKQVKKSMESRQQDVEAHKNEWRATLCVN